jgi:hypothetical protein
VAIGVDEGDDFALEPRLVKNALTESEQSQDFRRTLTTALF